MKDKVWKYSCTFMVEFKDMKGIKEKNIQMAFNKKMDFLNSNDKLVIERSFLNNYKEFMSASLIQLITLNN